MSFKVDTQVASFCRRPVNDEGLVIPFSLFLLGEVWYKTNLQLRFCLCLFFFLNAESYFEQISHLLYTEPSGTRSRTLLDFSAYYYV